MKKSILVLLFLAFLCVSELSYGQVSFSIGPKAGVTFTTFDADEGSIKATTSFLGGAFVNLNLFKVVSIQPEFLFRQRGAEVDDNKIKLNYFEVPILLKLNLPLGDVVYPNIFAGPSFAYRYGKKISVSDNSGTTTVSWNDADLEKTDVLGVIGAGIDFMGDSFIFSLDARHDFGFNKINDNTLSVDYKNRDWTFMAGLGFRIGN